MKKIIFITALLFSAQLLFSESADNQKKDKTNIIPLFFYENLSLDEQDLKKTGGGVLIIKGNKDDASSEGKNSFVSGLFYSGIKYDEEPLYDYPDSYKNIDIFLQRKKQHHQYFSVLQSHSDKPFTGGLETYAIVSGYGYEIIHTKKHSLYLGGSVAVSDFGIETENGHTWPVIPLPFIHYEYSTPYLFTSFDFTTSPAIDLVIAPESRIRLNTSLGLTETDCGLTYDANIEYRFFSKDSGCGDFAGIKTGIKTDCYSANLSGTDNETILTGWKVYYSTLDLSLLELTFGFAEGESYYDGSNKQDYGKGIYFNIQAACPF